MAFTQPSLYDLIAPIDCEQSAIQLRKDLRQSEVAYTA